MHERTSECYTCCGIGETLDEHGIRECLCCHGTGQVPDKLDHRQVEAELRDIKAHGNTLALLVFITMMATIANWVMLMLHFWVTR